MQLMISRVSKVYDSGVQALDQVSLQIPCGLFGLLGPNGAGKTSLMRILATLLEPDSGLIVLDGLDVRRQKDAVRRILGYLPQEFGLYPDVKAEDLLDHMARLKGMHRRKPRKEAVLRMLESVHLGPARKQKLGTFSGGMKQRFGIAMALIGSPQFLIVDEPTAGLDPEERNRFLNLLSRLGEEIIVILSTHIVEDVRQLCPRLAVIDEGRILLNENTAQAIRRLEGRIWRKTVQTDEFLRIGETMPVIRSRRFAGRTQVHVLSDQPIEGFEPVAPDLEDVYFHTIRRSGKPAEVRTARGRTCE